MNEFQILSLELFALLGFDFVLLMVVLCFFPLEKKRGGYSIEDILLLILHESTVERL